MSKPVNEIINKIKANKVIQSILPYIPADTYLVGGFIRDCYLDKPSYDIDLVIENQAVKPFAQKLAKELDGFFVVLDEDYEIYRIVLQDKKHYIDIAKSLGESFLDDLKRRDLTINAVALDLNNFRFFDPLNGFEDIKSGVIKAINEDNMVDDPLRLLRIFRFQSALGFNIDDETKNMAKLHAKKLLSAAKERQNVELMKLFEGKDAHLALKSLDEAGILELIIPKVIDIKKVPKNSHHHLDLFNHSRETVKQIQNIYEKSDDNIKQHFKSTPFGAVPKIAYLKLAGFLHDIGKPATWTIEDGKHRFIKHDDVGSKLVVEELKALNFSNKQTRYVEKMIKYHIYPSNLMSQSEDNTNAKSRFVRKIKEHSIDLIILAMADRLSARGIEVSEEMVNDNISKLNKLMEFYQENQHILEPLPTLLNGNEVMEILYIKPSKRLGKILKSLKEAQLDGQILTKQDAIDFIKQLKLHEK